MAAGIRNSIAATLAALLFLAPLTARAKAYAASLAQMPVYSVSATEGVLVDLVRAIEETSGEAISIEVYPFARSMHNLISGGADLHIPLIKNDIIPEKNLPYDYSSETIFHVNFVLYTTKGSGVTLDNLAQHKVETDTAHVNYFPFKTLPSSMIDSSLKKLSIGRIDAYIFADVATDPVLRSLGFKNIERTLYKTFEVKIILPKGAQGKPLDGMLSGAIAALRKSGKLQQIMAPVDRPYDDWQP